MVCCEYGFLVDHPDVCILDGVCDVGVDLIVIPVAVLRCSCINQALMIKVVTHCNNRCSCDIVGSGSCFRLFFSCSCFFLGIYGWFADQPVVQLVE